MLPVGYSTIVAIVAVIHEDGCPLLNETKTVIDSTTVRFSLRVYPQS